MNWDWVIKAIGWLAIAWIAYGLWRLRHPRPSAIEVAKRRREARHAASMRSRR